MIRAKNPFVFKTRLNLLEITGEKAKNLKDLMGLTESVPLSVVYFHTQHLLPFQQHLSPKSPNDFAYWIKKELHEEVLSEKIIALDLQRPLNAHDFKEKMIQLMKSHLASAEYREFNVSPSKEFNFIKAKAFIVPTGHKVYNLFEFYGALKEVSIDSIYLHLFGAETFSEKHENDFFYWLKNELKEKVLADSISRLDPFVFYATEGLRAQLIKLVNKRLRAIKKSEGAS
ncbi:MAG TPA: hypothetical protein ENN38_06020 [Actinobacteria bacterium]|nr:hypothetical protein [Actinomycetota bacterium]